MNNQIAVFEQKKIRHIEHEGEMYFSVVDVIEALTDSPNPRNYWSMLKIKNPHLFKICQQLKLKSKNGKSFKTDCTNTENALIIIMSIPSPKVHSFKLWLAEAGKEKLDRLNDSLNLSELIIDRAKSNINLEDCAYKTYLHKKFTLKRVRGEWFNLSEKDVNFIKSY